MKLNKNLIIILITLCVLVLSGCGKKDDNPDKIITPTPLVIGYDNLSSNYNPFFFDKRSLDVVKMVHTPVVLFSRSGKLVGSSVLEEEYNGNNYTYQSIADLSISLNQSNGAVYTITLKEGIVYSNGDAAVIDDLIFSLYVLLDKTYDGEVLLNELDIVGLKNYQLNNPLFESITDGEVEAELNNLSSASIADIRDFIYEKLYFKMEEMKAEFAEGSLYQSIFEYPKDAFAALYRRDVAYDSSSKTEAEVISDLALQYDYDYQMLGYILYKNPNYFNEEVMDVVRLALAKASSSEVVNNISGIVRINDLSLSIETASFKAQDIYKFMNLFLVPRNAFKVLGYDYQANSFGVERENLDQIKEKTVFYGLGAYKFVKEENNIIYFEANKDYYLGEALLKYVQFRKIITSELKTSLENGTIDMISSPLLASTIIDLKANEDIALKKSFYEGYGYLGINKDNITDDDVRYAFLMLFASYRFKALTNTLGHQAEMLNSFYDCKSIALNNPNEYIYNSKDEVEIYNEDTLMPDKQTSALNAFVEILTTNGYSYNTSLGKFTAASENNKLTYKLYISPYATTSLNRLATEVKAVLDTKGITLELVYSKTEAEFVMDVKDDKADFFIQFISDIKTINVEERYHSAAIGTDANQFNYFKLNNNDIDILIEELMVELDDLERSLIYQSLQDLLLIEAIELPVFQKINYIAINKTRIVYLDSLFENTVYFSWLDNINLFNNLIEEIN